MKLGASSSINAQAQKKAALRRQMCKNLLLVSTTQIKGSGGKAGGIFKDRTRCTSESTRVWEKEITSKTMVTDTRKEVKGAWSRPKRGKK